MLYAIVGLLFLLADQFLKLWTVAHVELNAYPGIELIPGVLNLTYIKNTGIAFGLFGDKPMLRWILLALLAAFTLFIVVSLATRWLRTGFARWTGVLLLTGLLGNGVDRAVYGYVVDMLEPKLGSISWPIFNIADALILIFGILFCIALISGGFGRPKRRRRKAPAGRGNARPVKKTRPEAGRAAAASARPRRTEGGDRPVRAPQGREPASGHSGGDSARPDPKTKEAPVRVTGAQAAEALRRNGSSMRPAEEPAPVPEPVPEEDVPVPAAPPEEPEVQVVPRPAPKEPAEAPAPETTGTAFEDLDLDSILAEFK